MRTVPEWVGRTPDTPPPPRVKLRIFTRYEGRCAKCGLRVGEGQRLRPEFDHITALINGGENVESNYQLLCHLDHKAKTAADVAEKSRRNRRAIKRNGLQRKRTIPGRKFDGTPIPARWRE